MRNSHKHWTPEEDEKLFKTVSRHSDNISYAFSIYSRKSGRTELAIRYHYYTVLKPSFTIDHTPFHNMDKTKDCVGVKNIVKEKQKHNNYVVVRKPSKITKIWKSILTILAE